MGLFGVYLKLFCSKHCFFFWQMVFIFLLVMGFDLQSKPSDLFWP